MNTQTLTVAIPTTLYERLRRLAAQSHRSIEAELVAVVLDALPPEDQLSSELMQTLQDLAALDDGALWKAARSHLPASASSQLEALHYKRQREGLSASEKEVLATLLRQYEQYMLVRAQAAVLLKARGIDISRLLE